MILYHRKIILLFLGLLLVTGAGWAYAQAEAELDCGGAGCLLAGSFSSFAVSGPAPAGSQYVIDPNAPVFGELIYEDYTKIELEARTKLDKARLLRELLSPYQGKISFADYVQKFDYAAGWNKSYSDPQNPYPNGMSLSQVIDLAEKDMREARKLYAFLAVYAPEHLFRADPAYNTDALCKNAENPNPLAQNGQVAAPVIDYCNFGARLRQTVRETAYMRMIFGQQFMADALGLQISGDLLGGENAVRQELARLQFAREQYDGAEAWLAESLDMVAGRGCYISDFFTETEWSLFSRIIQSRENALYQIAIRSSYLGGATNEGYQAARKGALDTMSQASADSYIKLVSTAGLAGLPEGSRCGRGERPDGALVDEMARSLLDTRRKATEIGQGRNVFGYDVTFTPARSYKSSVPLSCDTNAGDRGLWDEAKCAAEYALKLQLIELDSTRAFERTQVELLKEVERIRGAVDGAAGDKSGCYREPEFGNGEAGDQLWYACIENQMELLEQCYALVTTEERDGDGRLIRPSEFDKCMDRKDGQGKKLIRASESQRALLDLRGVYMGYLGIEEKAKLIHQRVQLSNDKNAIVTEWLILSGAMETVARVTDAALGMISCMDLNVVDSLLSFGTKDALCTGTGVVNLVAQGVAGGISTTADVRIAEAENEEATKNLLLDMSELVIEAYAAQQEFRSKDSEYESLIGALEWDMLEAQRARAYLLVSPANDPSFRMVRDSSRLQFSNQLQEAAKMSYLAARRAEYEYAARLSASNFRISDIYRARTAQDILSYLSRLANVTNSLAGSASYQTNARDERISVAKHVLLLTDEALQKEGFSGAGLEAERTRRFREWVAANTVVDPNISSKPILRFSFPATLLDGGLFSRVILEGYGEQWLLKMSGIGIPKASSNGLALNLVTDQSGLNYRTVTATQSGLVQLRSFAGCTFNYRLIAPAKLLNYEWAGNQDFEAVTATWLGNVNDGRNYTDNNFRAPDFYGRAASSTNWEVVVRSGAPSVGLPDMNLQLLKDVELIFSMSAASRTAGPPKTMADCTRIDW